MTTMMTTKNLSKWLNEEYEQRCRSEDPHCDMIEHLPVLRELTTKIIARQGACTVVEFGVGHSTIAFLAGGATVWSYDIAAPQWRPPDELTQSGMWRFDQIDTSHLHRVAPYDLLFIDTVHTYQQVKRELRLALPYLLNRGREYSVLVHGTKTFGERDEVGEGPGINRAVRKFCARYADRWRVLRRWRHGHGLTLLHHPAITRTID
jgi:hypothetical protein